MLLKGQRRWLAGRKIKRRENEIRKRKKEEGRRKKKEGRRKKGEGKGKGTRLEREEKEERERRRKDFPSNLSTASCTSLSPSSDFPSSSLSPPSFLIHITLFVAWCLCPFLPFFSFPLKYLRKRIQMKTTRGGKDSHPFSFVVHADVNNFLMLWKFRFSHHSMKKERKKGKEKKEERKKKKGYLLSKRPPSSMALSLEDPITTIPYLDGSAGANGSWLDQDPTFEENRQQQERRVQARKKTKKSEIENPSNCPK